MGRAAQTPAFTADMTKPGLPVVTAKTTSLKKTIVGLTPIRESDIQSKAMSDLAPKLGGLVEFYRSPARVAPGRQQVPTCLTIRSWRNCGGRTWP